jgi:hypothetical protein
MNDRSHITDIDVEIAEMLVPHAMQRAEGSGDPHVLEGPFDKSLYIGSSIGPPFSGNGDGSSGTFAAHFTAKRKAALQDELLLALTCDHVCFDSARPCLGRSSISNSSRAILAYGTKSKILCNGHTRSRAPQVFGMIC